MKMLSPSSSLTARFCLSGLVLSLIFPLFTIAIVCLSWPYTAIFRTSSPLVIQVVVSGTPVSPSTASSAVKPATVAPPARSLACAGAAVSPATWLGSAGRLDQGSEALYDSIIAAEDDGSSDNVPPEEACSEASEGVEEDQLMSGDEEVVTSAAPPPPSAPVSAPVPDVPIAPPVLSPVSDSPASVPSPVCDVKASVQPAPLVSSAVPPASPVSVSPDAVPSPVPSISASDAVSAPPRVSSVASSPVDPRVVAALRDIPHRDFLTFVVANFVTVSIEKFRLHPDSYSALTDYVSSFQRNVLKKMSSSKKPLKRPPAKLLDSEGQPARKPTRPDRVK